MRRNQLLQLALAALMGLLAWQGRSALDHLDRLDAKIHTLEVNQGRILLSLELDPVATDTLDFGVKKPVLGGL